MPDNIQKKGASQDGMTLIEIVVSLFLVGGLIVMLAAAMNIVASNKKIKNENIAYHIANKKMEEIRSATYSALPSSSSFADPELSQLPSGSANFTVGNYSTYSGMKEVVVTVNWNDGRARSISLKTLAGSGGINPQ